MPSFAETLHDVRRRGAFTQEQLAQEMNVSRQTISHWENGRAVPDIDTIKRLSQVLNYNFLAVDEPAGEPETAAPAPEVPAKPEAAAPSPAPEAATAEEPVPEVRFPSRRRFIIAAAAAVMLIAIAVLAIAQPWQQKSVKNPHTMFSYEWFNFDEPHVADQAYIRISCEEDPVCGFINENGEPYWMYNMEFACENDIGFVIEHAYLKYFNMDKNGDHPFVYEGSYIAEACRTNILLPGSPIFWRGGLPMQDLIGFGFAIEGTDSYGNHLTFTRYIALSQELRE